LKKKMEVKFLFSGILLNSEDFKMIFQILN
jgi:hypothetical protein